MQPTAQLDLPPVALGGTTARVLVVEDDPSIAEGLRIRLSVNGYDVGHAGDVPAALEAIASDPPHLVVLDVSIPGGTGFDVAHALRARPETRDTAIVFLTADRRPALRDRADRLGDRVRLFTKPFDAAELLDGIRGLLR